LSIPLDPLIKRAVENSGGCLSWLDVCGAECCKVLRFHKSVVRNFRSVEGTQRVFVNLCDMSEDILYYNSLHGGEVIGSTMLFDDGKIERVGDFVYVYRKCDMLTDDLLCKVHGTEDKPLICQGLSKETAKNGKYWLTPNCLFKRQLEAEE